MIQDNRSFNTNTQFLAKQTLAETRTITNRKVQVGTHNRHGHGFVVVVDKTVSPKSTYISGTPGKSPPTS